MDTGILKAATEYGIALVGLIFLSRFLIWLIKYILERNKQREESIELLLTGDLKALSIAMNTLAMNMTNFVSAVNEAHKFQRDEHRDLSEQHLTIITTQKEITTTLGRINGYKKD